MCDVGRLRWSRFVYKVVSRKDMSACTTLICA
jgi:hypothetical protein